MFYFSYGSNMSSRRLLSRVPSVKFVTVAVLPGHELHFHKKSQDGSAKCDAFETGRAEHSVHGVIYDIAESHKLTLDRIEGVGEGYEQKTVELITASSDTLIAYTYYATFIDCTLKPYHWYKQHVLAGALEYDLLTAYVEKLWNVKSIEDPDPKRNIIELMIYKERVTET
jgi:hypothetical protein